MSGKRGKNDAADAAAICEAVTRPNMRFVPVKEEHQQIILTLHRTGRDSSKNAPPSTTACAASSPNSASSSPESELPAPRDRAAPRRPASYANQCVGDMLTHADRLDVLIEAYDRLIAQAAREDARSKRLMQLAGIGPTTASALLASLGGAHEFNNGRQVAAWIGLTPGNTAAAARPGSGRITKAGDRYLRSLLVMGARAILSGLGDKQDRFSRWARNLVERRGYWKAVVAIAAKNARLAWAVAPVRRGFSIGPRGGLNGCKKRL